LILSHKYKFIFIKTRKTAGSSLELYLSKYCGPEDIVTPIGPKENTHPRNYRGYFNPIPELRMKNVRFVRGIIPRLLKRMRYSQHIAAAVVKTRLPEYIWDNYFKFCIERNPWDKVVSYYYWRKHWEENSTSIFYWRKKLMNPDRSFDDFLKEKNFPINHYLYTDVSDENRIIVDRIIKYENLNEELGDIFHKLRVPFDGSLNVHAKSTQRKERHDYRNMYNKKQKYIVAKAFEKELQLHGYQF